MGGKLMNNNNDSFTMEDRAKLIQARIDACDGDFIKYMEKYNRAQKLLNFDIFLFP